MSQIRVPQLIRIGSILFVLPLCAAAKLGRIHTGEEMCMKPLIVLSALALIFAGPALPQAPQPLYTTGTPATASFASLINPKPTRFIFQGRACGPDISIGLTTGDQEWMVENCLSTKQTVVLAQQGGGQLGPHDVAAREAYCVISRC